MTLVAEPSDRARTHLWLRGLLTIAWADGHFDEEEREVIAALTHETVTQEDGGGGNSLMEPISPEALAEGLKGDPIAAQNFLRTAVMVAIADGIFSEPEAHIIRQFSRALHQEVPSLDALQKHCAPTEGLNSGVGSALHPPHDHPHGPDVLHPVRDWLDGFEVHNPKVAKFLCKMIPAQCPFERDVVLFGRKIVHIPPMCKINPLYEQMVGLRFRALSYLADDCGEDVSEYC